VCVGGVPLVLGPEGQQQQPTPPKTIHAQLLQLGEHLYQREREKGEREKERE